MPFYWLSIEEKVAFPRINVFCSTAAKVGPGKSTNNMSPLF